MPTCCMQLSGKLHPSPPQEDLFRTPFTPMDFTFAFPNFSGKIRAVTEFTADLSGLILSETSQTR